MSPAAPPATAQPVSAPSGPIRSDVPERPATRRPRQRVAKPASDAKAAARAAYDAKPKVIVRDVDEDVYYKLAIYRHQLHTPDGIEGWSEFGRQLLRNYVDQYEQKHGEMTGGEDVELPPGRRLGS